jgi:hypothetical protein
MLNEAGGVIDDLIVYYLDESSYRVVVNAGTAAKDLRWMADRLADWQLAATITPRREGAGALAMIAVQGPNARQKVWQVLPDCRSACESLQPFFAARCGDFFLLAPATPVKTVTKSLYPPSRRASYGQRSPTPASSPAVSVPATRCAWKRA